MKAVVVRDWDRKSFLVEEVADPKPDVDQVTIAVHTAAVNFGDVLIATGRYQVQPLLPFIPGTEGSGVIEAVGPGVTRFKPGDRVFFMGFCGKSRESRRIIGSFAEKALAPAVNVARQPEGMTHRQAALFRSNYETAFYALQVGRLQATETLLVMGAAGGTGYAAVQIAKALGATVIASVSSEAKRQIALAGGADVAIDSNAEDWRRQIDEMTAGRGVDVIYDPVGGEATERSFRALSFGGRHLVIGFAAGAIPKLPVNLPLLKGASLVGANLLRYMEICPEGAEANIRSLLDLFEKGAFKIPPVARAYSLEQAVEALDAVASGKIAGRVVIDVACGAGPH